MLNKLLTPDHKLIKQVKKQLDDSIAAASNSRDWLGLADWLKKAAVFLNGVTDVTTYRQNLTKLINNNNYQKHLAEALKQEKTEH